MVKTSPPMTKPTMAPTGVVCLSAPAIGSDAPVGRCETYILEVIISVAALFEAVDRWVRLGDRKCLYKATKRKIVSVMWAIYSIVKSYVVIGDGPPTVKM